MNNPALLFPTPRSGESVKHRLRPLRGKLDSPYIEHWVIQLHGVDPAQLDNTTRVSEVLGQLVEMLELTPVSEHAHYFGPGVSAVVILSESHLSVHTWPEKSYAHLDIVTCVKKLTEEKLEQAIRHLFNPRFLQLAQLEY